MSPHVPSDFMKTKDYSSHTVKGGSVSTPAGDRVRLKLILRGKRLGFSLSEIGDIIDMYDLEPGEVGQLQYFIEKISVRRKTLKQQRNDIEVTLKELDGIEKQCRKSMTHLDQP